MTDLRARLADAVREEWPSTYSEMVDVLLSLDDVAIVDTSEVDLREARRLYEAAQRDWEFHDAPLAFRQFMSWIEDYFSALLRALPTQQTEVPEFCPGFKDPRCKGICTLSGKPPGKIADPDCFR